MKKTLTGKWLAGIAGAVFAALVFMGTPMTGMAYTQAVGIVSADKVNVRKEPSTGSEAVTGLAKGSSVTITDEVTDSAGAKWYKVTVENGTGYIRSDLMIKGAASTGTGADVTIVDTTATSATPIAETKAYVNYESAIIRQGASKNHDIVGSATKNTPVTITAEAKASDGKKWYQIKFTSSGGKEIVGFIRSDLVTVGDPPAQAEAPADNTETESTQAPASEGETPELTEGEEAPEAVPGEEDPAAAPDEGAGEAPEPAPEEETKPDYEMVYRQNDKTGEMEWYLFDNINGTMMRLTELLDAADAGVKLSAKSGKELSTERIIIIVLGVVAAILAVTVTLLLFKIKDLYDDGYDEEEEDDEDDEDEDDEEEEEEEPPVKRRKRSAKAVSKAPVRTSSAGKRRGNYDPEEDEDEEDEEEEVRPVKPSSKTARKAKNFLIDDDEFEFEFLNMEDKD